MPGAPMNCFHSANDLTDRCNARPIMMEAAMIEPPEILALMAR